jgi:hypothetical protein
MSLKNRYRRGRMIPLHQAWKMRLGGLWGGWSAYDCAALNASERNGGGDGRVLGAEQESLKKAESPKSDRDPT